MPLSRASIQVLTIRLPLWCEHVTVEAIGLCKACAEAAA